MVKNLYFDVCAIIIMIILFFSIFLHKMTKGRVNRIFIYTNICCMLAAIFDIGCESFGVWFPITESTVALRYLLFYGYFVFRNLTGLFYVLYLICLSISSPTSSRLTSRAKSIMSPRFRHERSVITP